VGKVLLVPLVGDRKATPIVVLFSCLLLLGSVPRIVFASSDNWVEVVTFHNIVGFWATSRFNVFHDDWRIKWEIYPSNGSESPSLTVHVYHDMGHQGTEIISSLTTHETTGILNIYNASGKFFLAFWATNTNSSSILIIEQNTDSIPEFPAWTILPAFLIVTLSVVVVRKKLVKSS
jgi:hypothetical protein